MKKTYEKPVLTRKTKLTAIVASVASPAVPPQLPT
ncbi:MAG: putative RiPP precursor [Mesorhizobium sp.]|nr:putative RiPP precursor [Mesorhizobium sp. M2A.F.Ca.ET.017.03.2.1]RVD10592.1 putative RiPP precursor [Mesorhizobium sp. M2A.F.Ca.ET.029.05.1.1]RWF59936.1 MAG: putative RiPP precursor [Mesorhizobium sp.]TIW58895.1 MAG: putative RiPP precursor [Mesorhizobium sp.]TIW82438.1 MAG: putative RiPP precursor [Mesorhizobium sp.]